MAMHQANYIPWIGYFHKMAHCDVFVYLDTVQYPRGKNFSARNKIKTPNGETFLTIPVSIPKGHEHKVLYTDVQFANQKWKAKHKKTILLNYKKAPYFEEIYALYCHEVDRSTMLLELNINLIEAIAMYLKIDTRRIKLSEILSDFGQKTDLIIDICKAADADTYLSGTGGGKEYNDEKKLLSNGIELRYADFHHPVYKQLWGDFIPNLSMLDLLFNFGAESSQLLSEIEK
jgi:hypothetical protein